MAQRGAPLGNKNGSKSKAWEAALKRLFTQDPEQLARIATKVAQAAEAGESWAVTEIGNRLDGKPVQQVQMDGDLTMHKTYRDLTDDALLAIAQRARGEVEGEGETLN